MTRRKRTRGSHVLLWVLCMLLGLVLIAVGGIGLYANHLLEKINYVDSGTEHYLSTEEASRFLAEADPEEVNPDAVVMEDGDLDWGGAAPLIGQNEDILNIMLIGQDARPGETRARSDVMILVTVNKQEKTLTLTSFLRDLYVQIPGYSNNRMNAAFAWGGMSLLNSTLETNFGVTVDGNFEVNFEEFASVIDLLGGVDVELTANEASVVNKSVGYSGVGSGMQHLNGDQALAYARIRKLDSDFGRTNRQRKVLTALFEKFKNSDLDTLMNLMNEVLPLLTTDLSKSEILSYAADVLPMLSQLTLTSQRIPADGAYVDATISGMAVLKADMTKARELLRDTLTGG